MKTAAPIFLCAAATFLTGCAVGPKYASPRLDVPQQWSAPQAKGEAGSPSDQWWKDFHDRQIDGLIDQAVAANHDLQLATARVMETRAERGYVKSGLTPQITASATATRDRQIAFGLLPASTGGTGTRFAFETNAFSGQAFFLGNSISSAEFAAR